MADMTGNRVSLSSGFRPAWLIAVSLAAIALFLMVELFRSTASAQPASSGRSSGVVAITGQISRDGYGIYLVDTENATICVYQYAPGMPGTAQLKLLAARTYAYDLKLDEYNSSDPSPRKIKELVEEQKRLREATTKP